MRRAVLSLVILALAGCATGPDDGTAAAPTSAGDELVVVVDRGDGSAPERHTLTCGDPADGDLPDPAAACDQLRALEAPFDPLPADQACTEQYGGPETALVTGRWAGDAVRLELARTHGCEIDQWTRLAPLLPTG
ncbi:SSI family serine proteinase inhibitor [Modestobacter versicolor]|uniref:SSI family serine proteinase inhibitor n=1 Tax=Modestobacter versicolor TaxID=429133 RepID=UPI0034DFF0BC